MVISFSFSGEKGARHTRRAGGGPRSKAAGRRRGRDSATFAAGASPSTAAGGKTEEHLGAGARESGRTGWPDPPPALTGRGPDGPAVPCYFNTWASSRRQAAAAASPPRTRSGPAFQAATATAATATSPA